MKRDLNIFRTILLDLEHCKEPFFIGDLNDIFPDVKPYAAYYHLTLLKDCNLVDYKSLGYSETPEKMHVISLRLTAQGHDFIDSIRDDSAFANLLSAIRQRFPDFSLALAIRLLGFAP